MPDGVAAAGMTTHAVSGAGRSPDVDEVNRHFQQQLPAADHTIEDVHVVAVNRMPRGVSRETWRVETVVRRAGGDEPTSYVIRRNHRADTSVDPVPLRFEYEVYRRLFGGRIPVARPLWFQDGDTGGIGDREFYVRECVDGSWAIPDLLDPDPRFDELRIEISKEHLRHLALVHTVDHAALGFADIMTVPTGTDQCALVVLEHHEAKLRSVSPQPHPVVVEAVRALRRTAPRAAPAVSLCKGTNGYGEEIFKDGHIVAMSDWELSLLGDPAYDFAQLQQLVPNIVRDGRTIWGEDQALDFYESVSGIRVDPANIEWYRGLNSLIKFTYTSNAAMTVVNGTNQNVRMTWVGTEVRHRSQLGLAAIAGIGVGTPG